MEAFITGSHAYGVPNEDSDIDLAITGLTAEQLDILMILADAPQKDDEAVNATGKYNGDVSLRFGRLNLICLPPYKFQGWKWATKVLGTQRDQGNTPTREEVIELIDRYVQEELDVLNDLRGKVVEEVEE